MATLFATFYLKVLETRDVDELVLANWKSQGVTGSMSMLEDSEVLFFMIQVGSYVSKWITIKNPSQHPMVMQLILNSREIINECRDLDDLLHPSSSSNLVLDEGATPKKYGFSIPENALTEAYVHPHDHVTLGPIIFYPFDRCGWSGSALIRNNLLGVEWIPLKGYGGLLSLVLLERSEHVDNVDFDLKMPKTLNFSLPYTLLHMKEISSACSQHLVKELYAKNTGDLPLEVKSIRVSGRECGLDGFKILSCKGFALEPGESTKLLISYQTDFSTAVVHQDLELILATSIFLLPMKASFPYYMLSSYKRSMYWIGDNLIHTTIKSVEKTLMLHHDQRKSKLSMSNEMNHLIEASSGKYSYVQGNPFELEISQRLTHKFENHEQTSHALDIQSERKLSSSTVQNFDPMEASQLGYLTVKTGKEKGRRRKRKSLGAKLVALFEVSSSQSGNSTPLSPLSHTPSTTPKCNWPMSPDEEQPPKAPSSMTQVATQHSANDQASATVVVSNILKPASTQSIQGLQVWMFNTCRLIRAQISRIQIMDCGKAMKVIDNCEGFAISRTMQLKEEVVRQFQRGLLRPFLTQEKEKQKLETLLFGHGILHLGHASGDALHDGERAHPPHLKAQVRAPSDGAEPRFGGGSRHNADESSNGASVRKHQ
ncbi:Transmembrane protein 131-like [Glycine soja]|nr:Transmembrane protein 131-like [Glycine soja]